MQVDSAAAPSPVVVSVLRGRALALSATLVWSMSGVAIRSLDGANVWQIACYRSLAMTVTLMLYLWWRYRGGVFTIVRAAGTTGVIAGVCLAGASFAYIGALLNTSVANALLLGGCGPVFAALIGWLVAGERVSRTTGLAIMVAGLGILVTIGGGLSGGGLRGDLLALLSAACFGAYTVALRRGVNVDMLPSLVIGGLVTVVVAGAGMVLSGDGFVVTGRDLAICLLLGAVQLGLGNTLFTLASRHLPAAELTLLALAELVFAPAWVWLAVGEVPAPATFAGGAIIVVALLVQAFGGSLLERRPVPVVTPAKTSRPP